MKAGATVRRAAFRVDENVSIKRDAMRTMLRLYGRSLDFGGDVDKVARDYASWAEAWNNKVSTRRGSKRKINTAIMASYVEHLDGIAAARASGKRVNKSQFGTSEMGMDNMRRQIVRYIRKGQRIAENVANGRFPGEYGE